MVLKQMFSGNKYVLDSIMLLTTNDILGFPGIFKE
jgi:hypothetical protein